MRDKAVITYIKNGIEQSIILNNFDELTLNSKLKDIFERKVFRYGLINNTKNLKLRDDISLVHIKNCVIDDFSYIYGVESNRCILILENCNFKKSELNIEGINKVKVLNPRWKTKRYCGLNFSKIKSLDVVLDEEIYNNYQLEIVVSDIDEFNLESATYLSDLFIMERVKNIYLKNFMTNQITSFRIRNFEGILTLDNSHVNVDKIWLERYLGSRDNNFDLNLINSSINSDNNENNFLEKVNNLSLIDSAITLNNGILSDKLKSIYLKRSFIRASGDIYFTELDDIIFDDLEDESILDTSSYLMVEDDKKIKLRDIIVRLLKKYTKITVNYISSLFILV